MVTGVLTRPIHLPLEEWIAKVEAANTSQELADAFLAEALGGAEVLIRQARAVARAEEERDSETRPPRPERIEVRAPGEVMLENARVGQRLHPDRSLGSRGVPRTVLCPLPGPALEDRVLRVGSIPGEGLRRRPHLAGGPVAITTTLGVEAIPIGRRSTSSEPVVDPGSSGTSMPLVPRSAQSAIRATISPDNPGDA